MYAVHYTKKNRCRGFFLHVHSSFLKKSFCKIAIEHLSMKGKVNHDIDMALNEK